MFTYVDDTEIYTENIIHAHNSSHQVLGASIGTEFCKINDHNHNLPTFK